MKLTEGEMLYTYTIYYVIYEFEYTKYDSHPRHTVFSFPNFIIAI